MYYSYIYLFIYICIYTHNAQFVRHVLALPLNPVVCRSTQSTLCPRLDLDEHGVLVLNTKAPADVHSKMNLRLYVADYNPNVDQDVMSVGFSTTFSNRGDPHVP